MKEPSKPPCYILLFQSAGGGMEGAEGGEEVVHSHEEEDSGCECGLEELEGE